MTASPTRGALMVCGTTSNAGKTTLVAGLCRLLARRGVSVAPFKAQNMALNSAVTSTGHEIGRAQYLQAQAARVTPEVAMNPILLKPTGERSSQVIVMGRPVGVMSAVEYHAAKPELFSLVAESLSDLRSRFDVVLIEGAGSPAEINLLPHDIVNLRLALRAGIRAIVVGDIDPGGVFASLYGTVAVLPDELRDLIGGFVINKLRGDPALLLDGTDQLEALSGVPTLGVVPMLDNLRLDAEDSLALAGTFEPPGAATLDPSASPRLDPSASPRLDIAVIGFPRISNFTDLDPLILEPDVAVRYVRSPRELGRPDLVVLPGSKATLDDLAWLRERGLDRAIVQLVAPADKEARGTGHTTVIGICGGYQMLGTVVHDEVESGRGTTPGLGLLDVTTTFDADKVLATKCGSAFGEQVVGYQIHHGRVRPDESNPPSSPPGDQPWLSIDDQPEGFTRGSVYGTTLHGLFDQDRFRQRFLAGVAAHAGTDFAPGTQSFDETRQAQLDRLADHLEASLDLPAMWSLLEATSSAGSGPSWP